MNCQAKIDAAANDHPASRRQMQPWYRSQKNSAHAAPLSKRKILESRGTVDEIALDPREKVSQNSFSFLISQKGRRPMSYEWRRSRDLSDGCGPPTMEPDAKPCGANVRSSVSIVQTRHSPSDQKRKFKLTLLHRSNAPSGRTSKDPDFRPKSRGAQSRASLSTWSRTVIGRSQSNRRR